MKVYNEQTPDMLSEQLQESLASYRAERRFHPDDYLKLKTERLNRYLGQAGLKSCVVAVSGGIDSALVLGIAARAAEQAGSPIERIVPVLLPVYDETAAHNQDDATRRGRLACEAFGLRPIEISLSTPHAALKEVVDKAMDVTGEGWASGQLVAYTRTPALYYVTSLLTQLELPGVVCGTTNRDEGGYLGYFGKASDGMVDLQLISDLHKSEVVSLSDHIGVPADILDVTPAGDMYDGRSDVEVFGAPYDFVELYTAYLCADEGAREQMKSGWSPEAHEQFALLSGRLEKLHSYNAHKYLARSPAVHLDVIEAAVPGGWNNE